MRDFKAWPPGAGARHQQMTGAPMQYQMHVMSLTDRGASCEPVAPLASAEGDAQAALSVGGPAVLKRAGRP